MTNTRVLIVDDSATMRRILRMKIDAHPDLCVIGEASDPYEARTLIKQLSPDILTLDIEMPRMNGLEFLKRLMHLRPMPVVMVSSLTQASTAATISALQLGALGCVGKPLDPSDHGALDELPEMLIATARANVAERPPEPSTLEPPRTAPYDPGRKIILIGASTGGVESLFNVLQRFPATCPPTFITQHIPAHFSASFAKRLDTHCAPKIVEASQGLKVEPGMVVIAPGGETHLEIKPGLICDLSTGARVSGHRPSVDVMFQSALLYAPRIAAALMTGMGRDGADGLAELRTAGAHTIAQDERTSVVYGMPKAAVENGGAVEIRPLHKIAAALLGAPISGKRPIRG